MASGSSPNSRANLVRTGGDRHQGKRALIAVIEASLAAELSDAEVRRHYGLEVSDEIRPAHRARMAAIKAPATYAAILDGWRAGMMGDLKETGGVNIGGILRIGKIKAAGLAIVAEDDAGQSLEQLGVPIFQRDTYANGFYAVMVGNVAGSPSEAQLLALGWFRSWAGGSALWFGPFAGVVWGDVVQVPKIGGGTVGYPVRFERWGTKKKSGAGFYVWAYVDGAGNERRVRWREVRINKVGNRLKSKIPNRFWADLNGVIY